MKKTLGSQQILSLIEVLKNRFTKNSSRHPELDWAKVQATLEANPDKLWSLQAMEDSGVEPDVVDQDKTTGAYIFYDCSAESPKGRRSACYDKEARTTRKQAAPENSAIEMAAEMGIEILDEENYRALQRLGKFDQKTSSWIKTPDGIRGLGGALFCDRRYDTVFVYHNGADSYYAARGFRGKVSI